MDKFVQKIVKITKMRYMQIITQGFMGVAALSIAGSIFSLIKSLPIAIWQDFLESSGLGVILSIPISITSDFIAVFVVLSMAYTLAKYFDEDPFPPALISLGSFMILTPFTMTTSSAITETGEAIKATVSNVIPVSSLGARGIFLAIIVGICASRLYIFFIQKGWKIKMPNSVPLSVSKMFESMIPGGLVFFVFLAIRFLIGLTSYETMQNLIYTLLQMPLTKVGGGTIGAIAYITAGKFLWWFGIHGDMVVYSGMAPIMKAAQAANISAFAEGIACPYPAWGLVTVSQNICALSLTILMFFSKAKQYKSLSKVAITTSMFNIGEPLIFGIPIIMNPIMAIPFILSPAISLLSTLFVMNIGLVTMITGTTVSYSMPVPLYLTFANSSWTGFVWGIVLIIINMALFFPFFRVADKMAHKQELEEEAKEITA